ncbi:MAG: DUF1552 domain-containing protein [Polyangiaceae bacterium]|jgi:hypothetical protein|nr:DUF1552 domain-containing protein [Polyangiaceae bacterium]
MKRTFLSRRTLLRGMLGSSAVYVGLPLLEAMVNSSGTALADGSPLPVRMITWFFGNGVILNRWVPGGLVAPVVGANYPLSPMLQPLQSVREYVSPTTGFDNQCAMAITHHEGMTLFNGYTFQYTGGLSSKAGGPTIDQVAASYIGQLTPSKASLQVGISRQVSLVDGGTTMQNLSHKGPNEPLPPEYNPRKVYQELFGSFVPPQSPAKPSRLGVLTAVRGDIDALRNRLGAADKLRLEAHLDGVAALETKINALAPLCEAPEQTSETNTPINGVEPLDAANEAMSDLIVYAFACDVTRIVSVLHTGGAAETVYTEIGESIGHHYHSHDFNTWMSGGQYFESGGGLARMESGVRYLMGHLAYLLNRLKATPDAVAGSGNLLDNSAILVGSDCAEGYNHGVSDQAALVIGGGGGRLVHPGIHVRQPGRNLSDVALTVLQAVVPEVTSIGAGPPASSTPVAQLKGSA